MKKQTRREILVGAAAVVVSAALPVRTDAADAMPDLGVLEWLEKAELDAMRHFPLPKAPDLFHAEMQARETRAP
jgi:hypothetical protein